MGGSKKSGVAIILIVMTIVTAYAILQWQRAERERKIALASEFAVRAQNILLSKNPSQEAALLLAALSMRLNPSGEAAQTLQNDVVVTRNNRTDRDGYLYALAFSPNGEYLATGSDKDIARVWEVSTGEETVQLPPGETPIISMALSDDNRFLVTGTCDQGWRKDHTARVWEVATGKEMAHMGHEKCVNAVAVSPDGKNVASGGYDRLIKIWELATGKEIATFSQPGATITALAFSPDGRYVVSGARDDYSVRVREISSGNEIAHMRHDDYVTVVAFSPDGKLVASGSDSRDASVRVWEVATGKEVARMAHDYCVFALAFSPDGRYLVSGADDSTVRVWEVTGGKEISRMLTTAIRAVAFSPDSRSVLVGNFYEDVYIWNWQPDDLIAQTCGRVTRNLDYLEWQKYIGSALPYQTICPGKSLEAIPSPGTVPVPTPY